MNKNEMMLNYLSVLSEMHNKKLSISLQKMYIKVLQGYDYKQLEAAFDYVIKNVKFFPKPVEIIEAITGGRENQALSAWSKVIDSAKKYGYYSSIDFGDPLITQAIIQVGGWKYICHTNSDDLVWVQKEFERIYKNLIVSRFSGTDTIIVGLIESKNRRDGFLDKIPEPIRIGEQPKKIGE